MTNYVKQKFQWFFDMATNTSACQRIDISAGGNDIYKRLSPFFGAFKHFKLGAVKIRMVPAATLPVDPTGLSYEAGENTVDPRDMFNPGLVRITNGEDLIPVGSINEASYYATMLDKRWYKFRLQTGFKRTATPLFWGVGQVHQDITPGASWNMLYDKVTDGNHHEDMAFMEQSADTSGGYFELRETYGPGSTAKALYQTGEKIRMGWLPTDAFEKYNNGEDVAYGLNPIPEVPIITVILPKAYKTKMYYRVFVEESVLFKDAVAINPYNIPNTDSYAGPADRYVLPVNYRIMGGGGAVFDDPIAGGGFDGSN